MEDQNPNAFILALDRAMVLLPLLPTTGVALIFSTTDLLYNEGYDGETLFPTTAEVDLIGAGGGTDSHFDIMSGQGAGGPALTGVSAQITVSGARITEDVRCGFGSVAHGDASLGLRGDFPGPTMTGSGTSTF